MEFYKILEKIMQSKNLSIPDVARNCGLTDSTVRSIFDRKQKKIALNVAFKLSDGLGVSLAQLNGTEQIEIGENTGSKHTDKEEMLIKKYRDLDERGKQTVEFVLDMQYQFVLERRLQTLSRAEEEKVIVLPMPLQAASAGTGQFSDDDMAEEISVVYNAHTAKADYVMRVSGDSMEPKFHDGDLVLVRDQPSVEIGEIGIYIIDGEQFIKLYKGEYLHSLNSKYEDVECTEDTFCRGKVIAVLDEDWIR